MRFEIMRMRCSDVLQKPLVVSFRHSSASEAAAHPALIGSHHTVCRISEYNEKNLHREQHKWSANNVKSGINANCHKRLGFQTKIMVAKVSRSFLRSLSVLNSVKHWHCIEMSLSLPSAHQPQYNILSLQRTIEC